MQGQILFYLEIISVSESASQEGLALIFNYISKILRIIRHIEFAIREGIYGVAVSICDRGFGYYRSVLIPLDLDALKAQIDRDAADARAALS